MGVCRHQPAGPEPLRVQARAADHASRVEALEASGATARFLQVHNQTGWGEKDATFVQMLLFDLAPPGTVLYVPDSLWSGAQWMAQLVAAALRGCRVYVVAPALRNGPSPSFPQMAMMQDLIARLVVVGEVLGDRIRQGGGDLRVGLFSREAPLDDLPGILEELEGTLDRTPFLRELFPFEQEIWERFRAASHDAPHQEVREASWVPIPDVDERAPQLHRKTHWIVDRDVVRALAASPAMPALVRDALASLREAMVVEPESGFLARQERTGLTRGIAQLYHDATGDQHDPVLYYTSGSMNMNIGSMTLDGEVVGVVAGPWALGPFVDFLLFSGTVTWVDRLEEMEHLLPPFGKFKRRLGRWLHRLM